MDKRVVLEKGKEGITTRQDPQGRTVIEFDDLHSIFAFIMRLTRLYNRVAKEETNVIDQES